MKRYNILWFTLIGIVLLGIFLRFYKLGSIPIALNRDEASLGYNAYSILKTGHDEHGVRLPLNFQSFGDWKLGGYIYALVPFISIFGLSEWSVKLPSALAGVFQIIVGFFIVLELSRNEKSKYKYSLAIIVALFIAISPWSVKLSRVAYEANLAQLLFLSGFLLSLRALTKQKITLQTIVGFLLIILSMATYHAYQVFVPLFFLTLCVFYWSELLKIFQKQKSHSILTLIGSFVLVAFVFGSSTFSANSVKFSGLSAFEDKPYIASIFSERQLFPEVNGVLSKLSSNFFYSKFRTISGNVGQAFSINFLFMNGGSHGSHDISGLGNMHLYEFIFVLFGIVLFIKQSKKWQLLILTWILVATIPALITLESAHTIRSSAALLPLEILSAAGLLQIIQLLLNTKNKYLSYLIGGSLGAMVIFVLIRAVALYFFIAPQRDTDNFHWEMKEISLYLLNNKDKYKTIYYPEPFNSPYIYSLFYWQYPPEELQEFVSYYPEDGGGFVNAKQLENIYFPIEKVSKFDGNSLCIVGTQRGESANPSLTNRFSLREFTYNEGCVYLN
ncbi:MAG: hypothetical protein COY80_04705 [Candidatus Pacebacteria bacterium CG_4_10_14_0_8_um_filter_42_14]|nr:MAG: hypothetical protein COY80_04705 [Candidatus Pacebacteria bacterium CG_4_10_14_0_8_um_filter_42_14]